jgi:hypothetical protein
VALIIGVAVGWSWIWLMVIGSNAAVVMVPGGLGAVTCRVSVCGWGGRSVRLLEFGAELVGVGVVELVEDDQGVLPGLVCGLGIAGGVVRVAEPGECVGFAVEVAEIPVQLEGVLVAGDCLGVVAEVVVGIADDLPCLSLSVEVAADLLVQGEGLLAGGEGLSVVPAHGVEPTDCGEGVGLPAHAPGGAVQVEGLLGVVEAFGGAALPSPCLGEADVGVGVPGPVAGVAVQVEGVPQMGVRVVAAA